MRNQNFYYSVPRDPYVLIYYHRICCLATNSVDQDDSSAADLFTCKMASTCDNLHQTFTAEEVVEMFARDNLVAENESDVDSDNQGMSSGEESKLDH